MDDLKLLRFDREVWIISGLHEMSQTRNLVPVFSMIRPTSGKTNRSGDQF